MNTSKTNLTLRADFASYGLMLENNRPVDLKNYNLSLKTLDNLKKWHDWYITADIKMSGVAFTKCTQMEFEILGNSVFLGLQADLKNCNITYDKTLQY